MKWKLGTLNKKLIINYLPKNSIDPNSSKLQLLAAISSIEQKCFVFNVTLSMQLAVFARNILLLS